MYKIFKSTNINCCFYFNAQFEREYRCLYYVCNAVRQMYVIYYCDCERTPQNYLATAAYVEHTIYRLLITFMKKGIYFLVITQKYKTCVTVVLKILIHLVYHT